MGLIGCLKGFRLYWIHARAIQSGGRMLTRLQVLFLVLSIF